MTWLGENCSHCQKNDEQDKIQSESGSKQQETLKCDDVATVVSLKDQKITGSTIIPQIVAMLPNWNEATKVFFTSGENLWGVNEIRARNSNKSYKLYLLEGFVVQVNEKLRIGLGYMLKDTEKITSGYPGIEKIYLIIEKEKKTIYMYPMLNMILSFEK